MASIVRCKGEEVQPEDKFTGSNDPTWHATIGFFGLAVKVFSRVNYLEFGPLPPKIDQ